ncbi:DUF459 domain-containing protein [Kaistia dalseonensis]|uniref:DUF459 domain-containing protein n=1 Tax=Kaistia dalseonensis TaxID=410840 RepID=A0ABU0HAU9_9HYPH|nr:SGNH family hydrolase [Kaistia dalseonensis]MCX5496817.1 DUF459 domain-containing protein [Kaistia dalseonensis]MDQ0439443.1 hypothetical protein [Kaistia dalseonensis]
MAPPADIPGQPGQAQRQRQLQQQGSGAPGQAAQPRKKRPTAPAEPPYPVVDVQPKDQNARKVLVIGDFMASGLAWGLDQAFAEEPRIAIIDRAEGSSGFVRDDHYDWAATLPELLDTEKPDMTVVMIGSNDRQQIRTADGKFAPRSEEWQRLYQQRVERFLLALQTYGKPVYWVGLPPLKSADGSADMAYLNTVFKARAEAVGVKFIDIWDGFADENGTFVSRGPDVDGQARQLRSGDGINFTKAGRRKLAFYVEREITQDSGLGSTPSAMTLTNPNETTEIGPDGKERKVGPILSLTDPAPGSADAALDGGGAAQPASAGGDGARKLTVDGEPPAPQIGRADDFAWKPPVTDEDKPEGSGASIIDGIVILPAATARNASGSSAVQ